MKRHCFASPRLAATLLTRLKHPLGKRVKQAFHFHNQNENRGKQKAAVFVLTYGNIDYLVHIDVYVVKSNIIIEEEARDI